MKAPSYVRQFMTKAFFTLKNKPVVIFLRRFVIGVKLWTNVYVKSAHVLYMHVLYMHVLYTYMNVHTVHIHTSFAHAHQSMTIKVCIFAMHSPVSHGLQQRTCSLHPLSPLQHSHETIQSLHTHTHTHTPRSKINIVESEKS